MKFQLQTYTRQLLADTLTPVNIYLKLRDVFAGSMLLESSDYHGHENSLSFICCEPLAGIQVNDHHVRCFYPDGTEQKRNLAEGESVVDVLDSFRMSFAEDATVTSRFPTGGLFGYTSYNAVRYFETIPVHPAPNSIPELQYQLYRYVIVIDHFTNEISLFETVAQENGKAAPSTLKRMEQLIFSNRFSTFPFHIDGEESSNYTDQEFLDLIERGKQHCYRGDVFQMVLSRRFTCQFKGDEFNVYRALRSINPSPYLFYFDYGNFKLFGSSPEAQLQVSGNKAAIFPIAGTFKRSGNDQEDAVEAARLAADEKENAEHIMLVDLARNDMSRYAEKVSVEIFREIQYYSHVIHLVSKVTGELTSVNDALRLASSTFPAGTLSGAPKHKAMTLINQYENVSREFYGGAIGIIGLNGSYNHAIMIRTFMSRNNQLIYQAGVGIVSKSEPLQELQEVNNKLMALRKAIRLAEQL